jgi:hypothetical protein
MEVNMSKPYESEAVSMQGARFILPDAAHTASRVASLDWHTAAYDLNESGNASLKQVLASDECEAIANLYMSDDLFRSRVVMARHGFGRGEYKYFCYPLPDILQQLRTALYERLAPIANQWNHAMGIDTRYPDKHAVFIQRCHQAGQVRPTPLLLQYDQGTTTACIRTSMASMSFRFRWRSFSLSPKGTSRAVNLC